MPCCCLNILNLCNKPVCGVLTLDLPASVGSGSGESTYQLILDYLDAQIVISEDQTDGEDIHFDISGLNENYQYTGKIYGPAGEEVSITVGEITYDCIRFKTVVNINPTFIPISDGDDDTFVILE